MPPEALLDLAWNETLSVLETAVHYLDQARARQRSVPPGTPIDFVRSALIPGSAILAAGIALLADEHNQRNPELLTEILRYADSRSYRVRYNLGCLYSTQLSLHTADAIKPPDHAGVDLGQWFREVSALPETRELLAATAVRHLRAAFELAPPGRASSLANWAAKDPSLRAVVTHPSVAEQVHDLLLRYDHSRGNERQQRTS